MKTSPVTVTARLPALTPVLPGLTQVYARDGYGDMGIWGFNAFRLANEAVIKGSNRPPGCPVVHR